jgi:hypothetical protein
LQDQVRILLDILPSKGPKAFGVFLDALRDDYDWLVDDLELANSNTAKEVNVDEPDLDDLDVIF